MGKIEKMIYIDSNIFIYAAVYQDDKGNNARKLIKKITDGEIIATTSALTFDEVFWIVKKERNIEMALEAGKALLLMQNLKFLKVDDTVLWQAYNLIEKHKLDPRDAIHAACAIIHGVYTIISEDSDFDIIKEFERKGLDNLEL